MSGVVAILRRDGAAASVGDAESMLARLVARASSRRASADGACAAGFAELTWRDGQPTQPLRDDARGLLAAIDARIDNRAELRAELGVTTDGDEELVLEAYARWGVDAPKHFVGDFAFVIWDRRRDRLVAARDHFGIRSLFYREVGGEIRVASEMLALFIGDERPRPSFDSFALFTMWEYNERGPTLLEGVHSLPAGHVLVVERGVARTEAYYQPDGEREERVSDDDARERFHAILREAVHARLRGRTPAGIQVSGGIDSSSIAVLTDRLRVEGAVARDPALLLHTAFPGFPCDEDEPSRALAEGVGLPMLRILAPGPGEWIPAPEARVPGVNYHPLWAPLEVLVHAATDRGLSIMVTGTGSDDIQRRTGHEALDALESRDFAGAKDLLGIGREPARAVLRSLRTDVLQPAVPRSLRRLALRLVDPRKLPTWLTPRAKRVVRQHFRRSFEVRQAIPARSRAIRQLVYDLLHDGETAYSLPMQTLFYKAHGLDGRHPFFDVRLVDFVLGLPVRQRAGFRVRKPLLHAAMEKQVPAGVLRARSHPNFVSYVESSVLREPRVRELFHGSRLEELGVVERGALLGLLDATGQEEQRALFVADLAGIELWIRNSVPG